MNLIYQFILKWKNLIREQSWEGQPSIQPGTRERRNLYPAGPMLTSPHDNVYIWVISHVDPITCLTWCHLALVSAAPVLYPSVEIAPRVDGIRPSSADVKPCHHVLPLRGETMSSILGVNALRWITNAWRLIGPRDEYCYLWVFYFCLEHHLPLLPMWKWTHLVLVPGIDIN